MKAFPSISFDSLGQITTLDEGMDLVDYFAAKAMQSLIIKFDHEVSDEEIGISAYSIAYEMMEIREEHIKRGK